MEEKNWQVVCCDCDRIFKYKDSDNNEIVKPDNTDSLNESTGICPACLEVALRHPNLMGMA